MRLLDLLCSPDVGLEIAYCVFPCLQTLCEEFGSLQIIRISLLLADIEASSANGLTFLGSVRGTASSLMALDVEVWRRGIVTGCEPGSPGFSADMMEVVLSILSQSLLLERMRGSQVLLQAHLVGNAWGKGCDPGDNRSLLSGPLKRSKQSRVLVLAV